MLLVCSMAREIIHGFFVNSLLFKTVQIHEAKPLPTCCNKNTLLRKLTLTSSCLLAKIFYSVRALHPHSSPGCSPKFHGRTEEVRIGLVEVVMANVHLHLQ